MKFDNEKLDLDVPEFSGYIKRLDEYRQWSETV